ncbi:MAG: hypothetical protein J7500_15535 [Sphingomonas sp.]|uniref:hypothetical protein n=1 Tax=Sphingomonas sp. TaxID=28214 RepID=UPI001B2ECE8D|nr:hypothetical protein [Sphingomonas sp.]MBO9624119.1 hypothetical protein [Sphingomonas sp.]
MPKSPPLPISTPIPELQGIASIATPENTPTPAAAVADRSKGDPVEEIARAVCWHHFGLKWEHAERQSREEICAMVRRMLGAPAAAVANREALIAKIDAEIQRITGWHPSKEILAECRAILALAASDQSVAGGWVLVPREPTEAMIEAYFDRCRDLGFTAHITAAAAWSAMIAAAPTAQSGGATTPKEPTA